MSDTTSLESPIANFRLDAIILFSTGCESFMSDGDVIVKIETLNRCTSIL